MTVSMIKYFLVLAEVLSFTKAADQLFMSQSVLSRQIAQLEQNIGVSLFIRNNKTVELTPAGKILYDGFKDMQIRYISLVEKAIAADKGLSGTINIGALFGQMTYDFLPYLESYEEQNPDVFVSLEAMSLKDLRQKLFNQQLDIVYSETHEFDYFPNFEIEPIKELKVCIVLPSSHDYYDKDVDELKLIDFKDDVFIVLSSEESTIMSRNLLAGCKDAGFSPKQTIVPDLANLMLMLEAGRGVAAVDISHAFSTNPLMKFVPLPELGYFEVSVVRNIENHNPCAQSFMNHIKEFKSSKP